MSNQMNDNLRVRLEFTNFLNPNLRNSLFSFKRSETKDVNTLKQLIRKRFQLTDKFSLFIDNFVLERTEPIDILRDNDLIVIQPKHDFSITKVKTEPIAKTENSTSNALSILLKNDCKSNIKSKSVEKPKKKSNKINEILQNYRLDCHSLDPNKSIVNKPKVNKNKINTNFEIKNDVKSVEKTPKQIEIIKENTCKQKVEEVVKVDKVEEIEEVSTLRNVQLRRAFKMANTSIKKKPQLPTKRTTESTETSKPKKWRSREATERMDTFSPFIILDRLTQPNSANSETTIGSSAVKKQSARKTFPKPLIPSKDKSNESIGLAQQSIDYENCEPLIGIPQMGDLIAFKMLTLSKDDNRLEASHFKLGSVLSVNNVDSMVDILLDNAIQNNESVCNNSTENMGIFSLKINWSTVLEPKLIGRVAEVNAN